MGAILKYLQNRLQENTTWYAIFMVAAAYGFNLDPAKRDAFVYLGMIMAGAPNIKIGGQSKQLEIKHEESKSEQANSPSIEELNRILNDDRRL
jgi:hypothetical protein